MIQVYKDLRNCDDHGMLPDGTPCKNNSAMWDTYNTYSNGHGGCCETWSGDDSPYGPMYIIPYYTMLLYMLLICYYRPHIYYTVLLCYSAAVLLCYYATPLRHATMYGPRYGPMGNYFCGNSSAGGWVGYDDPRGPNKTQGLSPALPVGFDYDPAKYPFLAGVKDPKVYRLHM